MDGWIARAYDRGVQAAFRDVFPALVEDLLTEMKDVRRGLDVGCGPGQFTILFAERLPNAEVWGIDLAPTMIDLARQHASESSAAARISRWPTWPGCHSRPITSIRSSAVGRSSTGPTKRRLCEKFTAF
jgi:trans-aconitate methyltransferase